MSKKTIGFALCGSFCTFSKAIEQITMLIENNYKVIPIMSENAYSTDTRFGNCIDINKKIESICNHEIIHTITDAEPFGPKSLLDLLIIAPCTGNTLGKMANGITDTSVTMAAKSHMRNNKPVLIAVSSNDALSTSAKNIGMLQNNKNIFFVPYGQDDPNNKPTSLVAHFDMILPSIENALKGTQIQPILV